MFFSNVFGQSITSLVTKFLKPIASQLFSRKKMYWLNFDLLIAAFLRGVAQSKWYMNKLNKPCLVWLNLELVIAVKFMAGAHYIGVGLYTVI